ncbi:MAG: hypothetical protein RM021_030715 [Nostoc sp. EkiNYC01]|nr:hypothetical protein [Nostoc sp. EkiNYC01]
MATALKILEGGNQRASRKSSAANKSGVRPHCKISIEDAEWISQQLASVKHLWIDCIKSEQFGGSAHLLKTNLDIKSKAFRQAKTAIEEQGLFTFERVYQATSSGQGKVIGWKIANCHGYYNRQYWEEMPEGVGEEQTTLENPAPTLEQTGVGTSVKKEDRLGKNLPHLQPEKLSQQKFQNPNNVTNHSLTTYQQPTKVVGTVVGSDAKGEILRVEQTAIAPLRGASPQPVESASEQEEDSPTANDCTTLTLVDATEGQSASLSTENQDCGEEVKDCSSGGSSAAPSVPPLQNLTNTEIFDILDSANLGICPPKDAIAVLMKTPHARSLMGIITNNPQWGIKLSNYSTVPQDFSQNSKLRSQRLNRLKSYALIGECPPDKFLQECQSDPVLKIQLSRLAAREYWDI